MYKSLGFKSEKDFISYLSIQNIQIDWVKNKLKIESLWNNLIYRKHKNQIVVDEDKIKKQVLKEIKSKKKKKKIFLSEILIIRRHSFSQNYQGERAGQREGEREREQ